MSTRLIYNCFLGNFLTTLKNIQKSMMLIRKRNFVDGFVEVNVSSSLMGLVGRIAVEGPSWCQMLPDAASWCQMLPVAA